MRTLLTTSLVLIPLLFCCNSKRANIETLDQKTLKLAGTLNFRIAPSSSNQTQYLQYLQFEGQEYLAMANKNNYSIEVYSFSTKDIIQKYKLPTSGPYDIKFPQMFGFLITDWDSVFVGLYNRPNFLMLNKQSEVTDLLVLKEKVTNPVFLSRAPITRFDNAFLTASSPIHTFDQDYWKNPLFTSISFHNKSVNQFYRPPLVNGFKIYGGFHNHHSYTLNKDAGIIVSNLSFDSNLYVYSIKENKLIKTVHRPSRYFDEVPAFQKVYQEFSEGSQEHYIENPSYKSILYDKWRDLYYRIVEQGVELKDTKGNFNTWYDKKPSVIILNSEFEVLGETDLLQSMYRISDAFVGEKGLYIAANNEKNPRYNEDEMVFDIYVLENK
jgi:hypothetical protein